MNRQTLISRSLVVLAALVLAAVSTIAPFRAAAPAVPVAYGCNDPLIGGFVGVFATCEECEFTGMDGASQGVWTTWKCRAMNDGYYYLYAT